MALVDGPLEIVPHVGVSQTWQTEGRREAAALRKKCANLLTMANASDPHDGHSDDYTLKRLKHCPVHDTLFRQRRYLSSSRPSISLRAVLTKAVEQPVCPTMLCTSGTGSSDRMGTIFESAWSTWTANEQKNHFLGVKETFEPLEPYPSRIWLFTRGHTSRS